MDVGDHEQTVAALRAELHERAGSEASLRGQLTEARAELEGRAVAHGRLEAAQQELREQLEELRGLVEGQLGRLAEAEEAHERLGAERDLLAAEVAQLRDALAASRVASDAAGAEAAGLRAELERLGAELGHTRAQDTGGDGPLDEARSLLAEAQALREKLAGAPTGNDEPPVHSG